MGTSCTTFIASSIKNISEKGQMITSHTLSLCTQSFLMVWGFLYFDCRGIHLVLNFLFLKILKSQLSQDLIVLSQINFISFKLEYGIFSSSTRSFWYLNFHGPFHLLSNSLKIKSKIKTQRPLKFWNLFLCAFYW